MTGQGKKRILCWTAAVLLSVVLASLTAFLPGEEIRNYTKDFIFGFGQDMAEREYSAQDAELVDYQADGSVLTSTSDDPQMLFTDVNDYVQKLNIYFLEETSSDMTVEVFYSSHDTAFTPEQSFTYTIPEGSLSASFAIRRKVASLRLDIGTQKDTAFRLQCIRINEDATAVSLQVLGDYIRSTAGTSMWLERVKLLTLVYFFLALHLLLDVRKIYRFLFEKRWLVCGLLLVFLVCNRYHGDSMSMYDYVIQQGEGSEYVQPVFGQAREIRSDEWAVSTPITLSTQFLDNPYGKYNDIIRGTDTVNSNAISFYQICNPTYLVRVIITEVFGFEYGFSFSWYAPILLTFLMTLELFLILTGGKWLLSVCGTFMVVSSSFYLWWGFPSVLFGIAAPLVCAYHYINSTSWKAKIPLALGTAVFTAGFVVILYPAWQVPIAYVALAILVWMIHSLWDKLKKQTWKEWAVMGAALLFCCMILLSYLSVQGEYAEAITQTEYPGSRVDYGGYSIYKLFNYIPAVLYSYLDYANPSEQGVCIGFFPIPMIMALYLWIRSKKKDWLVAALLLVCLFLGLYTTVGLPPLLAKATLMTYSMSWRAVDILGYLQVILFVLIFSRYSDREKLPPKPGMCLAVVAGIASVLIANYYHAGYMNKVYMFVILILVAFILFVCIARTSPKVQKIAFLCIIGISLVTGIYVRPLVKGTDAIYSKPLAKEIVKIAEENDGKWLAYGGGKVLPSFAVACGAPTINSVNTYPNMELWRKLDEDGEYNMVYNRYAHVDLAFTEEETSMELVYADSIKINLSYQDIIKTQARYIVSLQPLQADNDYVTFKEIYQEDGSYIYEIQYH